MKPSKHTRWMAGFMAAPAMTGCDGNVGIGMSVGVPVGNCGYMSVGTHRWL